MGEGREARERLARLQAAAAEEGIDRLAIASPERTAPADRLDAWLARGDQAGMAWMERHRDLRLSPERFFPGVRSIVSVAWNHYRLPPAGAPGSLRIARYAWGDDYHRALRGKLERIVARLRERVPEIRARVAVDTSPVLERHWAAQAGLGWIGRSGCLIVPGLGSWVFLGEIFLDIELPAGEPLASRCGGCRRCLEACPGGALSETRPLDARRCGAYWSVEHRGALPADGPFPLAPWLFGCDICQEVCPWNAAAPACAEPASPAIGGALSWRLEDWEALGEAGFARRFGGTPLARAGYQGILRNARHLSGRAGGGG